MQAPELRQVIVLLFAALALLWLAWVALGQLLAWTQGQEVFYGLLSTLVRGAVVIGVLGFFIR